MVQYFLCMVWHTGIPQHHLFSIFVSCCREDTEDAVLSNITARITELTRLPHEHMEPFQARLGGLWLPGVQSFSVHRSGAERGRSESEHCSRLAEPHLGGKISTAMLRNAIQGLY